MGRGTPEQLSPPFIIGSEAEILRKEALPGEFYKALLELLPTSLRNEFRAPFYREVREASEIGQPGTVEVMVRADLKIQRSFPSVLFASFSVSIPPGVQDAELSNWIKNNTVDGEGYTRFRPQLPTLELVCPTPQPPKEPSSLKSHPPQEAKRRRSLEKIAQELDSLRLPWKENTR